MPEDLHSSRSSSLLRTIVIAVVLLVVAWLAFRFLIAAVQTIVYVAVILAILWLTIRFLSGGRRRSS